MKAPKICLTALVLVAASSVVAQDRTISPPELAGLLAGTLVIASGDNAPAAVIIPGSGPTDRDGNGPLGMKASSYRLMAEGLADEGISTLRFDKRGMFGSSKAIPDGNAVTLDAYADDALAWAADLRLATNQKCVWLIGHSEGGLVAMTAAARLPDGICGVILIAAPGRPLGEVLQAQLRANPANAPLWEQAGAAIASLSKGERYDTEAMHPALLSLFAPAVQNFLISLFAADPAALIVQSQLPLMIVWGEEDLQVGKVDADVLAQARPDAAVLGLPGVNHVLKAVPKGDTVANMASYSDPDLPLAPGLAEAIADYIMMSKRSSDH